MPKKHWKIIAITLVAVYTLTCFVFRHRIFTGAVLDAQFSDDGRFMATASNDHTCKLWDTSSFLRDAEDVYAEQSVDFFPLNFCNTEFPA